MTLFVCFLFIKKQSVKHFRACKNCKMKLEEAIVFILANSGHGMKTDQIAREINERGLYQRWDKEPVSEKQVWAVVLSHPETFVKSDGRIRLMI